MLTSLGLRRAHNTRPKVDNFNRKYFRQRNSSKIYATLPFREAKILMLSIVMTLSNKNGGKFAKGIRCSTIQAGKG